MPEAGKRYVEFKYEGSKDDCFDVVMIANGDGGPPFRIEVSVYATDVFDIPMRLHRGVTMVQQTLDQLMYLREESFAGTWGDEVLVRRRRYGDVDGEDQSYDLPF